MLTKKKRRILFYISLLAFALLLVPVLLYSLGYGITGNLKLTKTGGIFIQSSESGVVVHAGSKSKHTSLLGNSAFLKNLLPGSYRVSAEKEGFFVWQKTLEVLPETVTSRSVLLTPENIGGKNLGTSSPLLNIVKPPFPSVKKYWKLASGDFLLLGEDKKFYINKTPLPPETFSEDTLEILRESKTAIFADGDQRVIFWDSRNIDSLWLGEESKRPQWQKENAAKIFTSLPQASIREVFEYPDWPDYLLISMQNGIFVVEMDSAGGQNIFPVYKGKLPSILQAEPGKLLIKDDGNFLEIEIP